MEIIELDIKELHPYADNPRYNDDAVDYVANSIKEFGFKVPLVIDKDHNIVTGHTRYKACQQLGIKSVPCVIADDLTEDQVKAFRLADNKVAEYSTWNFNLLDFELEDIQLEQTKLITWIFMRNQKQPAIIKCQLSITMVLCLMIL